MESGLTSSLLAVARDNGAAIAGVAGTDAFEAERRALSEAVRTGRSGPLHFTHDDPDTATDIRLSLPWAQSLVVLATGYADMDAVDKVIAPDHVLRKPFQIAELETAVRGALAGA